MSLSVYLENGHCPVTGLVLSYLFKKVLILVSRGWETPWGNSIQNSLAFQSLFLTCHYHYSHEYIEVPIRVCFWPSCCPWSCCDWCEIACWALPSGELLSALCQAEALLQETRYLVPSLSAGGGSLVLLRIWCQISLESSHGSSLFSSLGLATFIFCGTLVFQRVVASFSGKIVFFSSCLKSLEGTAFTQCHWLSLCPASSSQGCGEEKRSKLENILLKTGVIQTHQAFIKWYGEGPLKSTWSWWVAPSKVLRSEFLFPRGQWIRSSLGWRLCHGEVLGLLSLWLGLKEN